MMDYFFLHALVGQLQPLLQGALLTKVFQPQEHLIILRLWNGGRQRRLLIDLRAETLGLYLSDTPYRNPMRPPRFCQLLRARLHRLLTIQIADYDRIVKIEFSSKDGGNYLLLVELLGRASNMLLLDEHGCVVDCMLRAKTKSERAQVVGQLYNAPIAHVKIPLKDAAVSLIAAEQKGELNTQWLMQHVFPMSKAVAVALQKHTVTSPAGALSYLNDFNSSWQLGHLQPCVQQGVLTMTAGDTDLLVSLSDFAEQFYTTNLGTPGGSDELVKAVKKGLKKLRQRLEKIEQQIDVCLLADEQRKTGELLLANLHRISRGMDEISVLDYYQEPPVAVVIPLDSAKLPQANAEIYFKRYGKAKRGLEHCERREEQTNSEIAWLQQIEQQLTDEIGAADLDLIRQELIETGYYVPRTAIQRETRAVSAASLAKRGQTPNGWEVLWGNNNKTNDYITKNLLKPLDLWLHAHNVPGCHVILKNGGAEVAAEDVNYAANIAAKHSRSAKDSRVDVMVAEGRCVQRIKGAPAGLVKVKQYRVVTVKLD